MKRSRRATAKTSRPAKEKPSIHRRATKRPPTAGRRVVAAAPDDLVSFTVVCVPATGATLDEVRSRLSARTVKEFHPDEAVRRKVVTRLRQFGFEVFAGSGPVVAARGTVQRFSEVFGGRFEKTIRRHRTRESRRPRIETSIRLQKGAIPSPEAIPEALLVAVSMKPIPATPSIPPGLKGLNLRVPGDIAQLTRASATHRRSVPTGDRATGGGITVAVVDTGFAEHPYYSDHDYRITRMSASDVTTEPTEDEGEHGTCILASLFACAPDAHALAVKYDDPVVALHDAINYGGVNVLSLSWGYDLYGEEGLASGPLDLLPLQIVLLDAIASGITVVAAAGNGTINFPAMMPEVIAVGGASIDHNDAVEVWDGASSFRSVIFKGRDVPDLCAFASHALLPLTRPAAAPEWLPMLGGTSLATCQVAGIVALLLQKDATLTPLDIRDRLMGTATDITSGISATGDAAAVGVDLASGAGLVNALAAWNSLS